MNPRDLIDDIRSRINPAYADQLGTESYERRLCAEALESIIVEQDELRQQLAAAQARIAELEAQSEPVVIEEPDYHYEAMGCGLEDRNITDRYEAIHYGWDRAIERMFEQIPDEPLYLHAPLDVPEGWKLVPIDPTRSQLDAARDWSVGKYGAGIGNDAATGCYAAMLAAAPSPEGGAA